MAERKRRVVSAHEVQAAVEGVEIVGGAQKVTFMGQEFRMSDKIGLMPLMHLAVAGKRGLEANDMDGLVALYEVIRDCIEESEWPKFEKHAVDTKADGEDLQKVVADVIEVITARPTQSPGNSSPGRPQISANSKASSSETDTPTFAESP